MSVFLINIIFLLFVTTAAISQCNLHATHYTITSLDCTSATSKVIQCPAQQTPTNQSTCSHASHLAKYDTMNLEFCGLMTHFSTDVLLVSMQDHTTPQTMLGRHNGGR